MTQKHFWCHEMIFSTFDFKSCPFFFGGNKAIKQSDFSFQISLSMASLKNAISRSGNYKVEPFYQCLLIPLASLNTKINQNQQLMFFLFLE